MTFILTPFRARVRPTPISAPPPPPGAAAIVSLFELDGDFVDSGPAAVAGASGSVEFGIDPLVADAAEAVALNGTTQDVKWPASAEWRNTAYGLSGRFQFDVLTAARQQVLVEMDQGVVQSLPSGGVAIDVLGDQLYAYTRSAAGGGGSAWWVGNPAVGGARPASGLATIEPGVSYLFLLTVDPEAVDPTKLWLWKAGRINMHSRGFGTQGLGTTDRVATSGSISLAATDDVTVSFWLWQAASQGTLPRWFALGVNEHVAALVDPTDANVRLMRLSSAGAVGQTNFPLPSTGQWVHVVAAWNGTAKTWALYYDTVSQSGTVVTTLGTGSVATDSALQWGNNTNGNRVLNGRLDEGAVWRRVLTSGERSDLEDGTLPEEIPADLISYVTMDGHRNKDEIGGGALTIIGTVQLAPAFTVASPINTPVAPVAPIGVSDNTRGLQSNDSGLRIGSYKQAAGSWMSGVVDQVAVWSGAPGIAELETAPLEVPTTISRPGPGFSGGGGGGEPTPGNGITVPAFAYQVIADPVPASNLCWWNPTSGNNGNNGSTKALAKLTFADAQAAIGAGGTIVVVGGRHTVSELVFTKSGTSGNRLKLVAEPGVEVVLYRSGEFKGGLERTWSWSVVNAGLGIWQSPALGIPDGATIVNRASDGAGQVTNGLWGFMRCPNGAHGRPHLMRMHWYDRAGNYNADAFTNPRNGNLIGSGGYGGPGFFLPGDGRIQVRMQKAADAYLTLEWPSDGRMGTLIDADGRWQEPISENPNDYEFEIVRFTGDYGINGPTLFNMNGQKWWHIKGINGSLMNRTISMTDGSTNNWFEKCTWYSQGIGVQFAGTSNNNTFTRCMFLSADNRSLSWSEHKNPNYWWQHSRTAGFFGNGGNANTGANTLVEHCTFFGWFDIVIGLDFMNSTMVFDHSAILNTGDDGFMQNASNGTWGFNCYYCYIAGGPPWSGNGNQGIGPRDWHWHHCVIDHRIPMLWSITSQNQQKRGVHVNSLYPIHSGGATGPLRCMKFWNNTVISSPDTMEQPGLSLGTSPNSHNLPSGRAHEVYNNIVCIIDNKRYPGHDVAAANDSVMTHTSCQFSSAGCHRYDYNAYFRSVPSPSNVFFKEIQNSRQSGMVNFASLAAFRSSALKTTSESMFLSRSGAFSGAVGIDGHDAHSVQVNPGFVDLANRDYRPTHASVISGALSVASSGWAGAADAHNWKGALDPDGDGTEVGPQPE